jgi:DNA-binding response OmpR family regulator
MSHDNKPLILNIDDDLDMLEMTERVLTDEGYKVVTAQSGSKALQDVKDLVPDLILLDARLPDMDGATICSVLRASKATAAVPVIFLTGSDCSEDKAAAFAAGADDYLVKPVPLALLLKKVRIHLKNNGKELASENL